MLRRSLSTFFLSGLSGGFFRGLGNNTESGGSKFFGSSFGGGNGSGGVLNSLMDKALEWCSTSHAYDIARQEGIDMKDIKFEHMKDGNVRVLIDAPNATQLQIERLGQRVEQECPVARMRTTAVKDKTEGPKMKWLRLPDKYDR